MFVVEQNGRIKQIGSLPELDRWIQRGKIEERSTVMHVESGNRAPARDFIEGVVQTNEGDSEGPRAHPQDEINEVLKELMRADPTRFDDEDVTRLNSFYKRMKNEEMEGRVKWDSIAALRSRLNRIRYEVTKQAAIEHEGLDKMPLPFEEKRPAKEGRKQKKKPRASARQGQDPARPVAHEMSNQPGALKYRMPESATRTGIPGGRSEPQKPVGFLHQPFVLIIALIAFYPVGLILLWTAPKHSPFGNIILKIILTLAFGGGWLYKVMESGDIQL